MRRSLYAKQVITIPKNRTTKRKAIHASNGDAQRMNGLPPASAAAYDAAVTMGEPRVTVQDAFSNPVARLGFGTKNLLEATEYPMTRLTQNYMLLNSLYRNNWVIQNIVATIPEDMTKKWFRPVTKAPTKYIDKFNNMQRQIKLRKSVLEGMKWGRLYGGAVGLILIAGQEDILDEPLELDTILPDSFKGLYIVDRWSGVYPDMAIISDIGDPDFGLPEYYEVRNELGVMTHRVHHSRVVRFTGRELPYWERIVEQYWGQSEIEAIYDEVVKRDNVSNNIASLTFKANLSVYEMENLDQLFAVGGTQAQKRFWNMIQSQSVLESNLGVKMINKGDTVSNIQYTFTGLAEVYSSIMMDVSGAARIPVTKLFGRSPAGLNATGESDLQNYYDYIEESRETHFRPIVERLLPIMALSAWGEIPDDLDFIFDSVKTESDTEKANIAKTKTATLIEAFNANGMTQEAFMKELKALSESTGMFESITDEMIANGKDVWAKDLTAMNDPMAGLMMGGSDGGFGGTDGAKTDDYESEPDPALTSDGGPGSGRTPEGGTNQEESESSRNSSFDKLMGKEYTGVKGQAAIEKLMEEKQGHVKEAFYRDDIGGIDLFWGDNSAGLQHIINERNKSGISGQKFTDGLSDVIERGTAFSGRGSDRLNIAYKGKVAVVTFELRGTETTALLTAFHTKK